MSNFAPASHVVPYRMIAGQPFAIAWALSVEDGSVNGTPFDMTSITDVQVVAVQRVSRGFTPPAATVWDVVNESGVVLTTTTIGGVTYPAVQLNGPAPATPGVYDVDVVLFASAAQDWLLRCTFQVVEIATVIVTGTGGNLDFSVSGNPNEVVIS
jgi:hypothetical protein